MKKILFLLLFFATPAFAGDSFFVCVFKETGERFNIVTINGQDKIQWGTGDFESVISNFDGKFLKITQIGRIGVFKMAFDVKSGEGLGVFEKFNGEKMKGEILCAVTE
jgi:hypothetical protein